MLKRLRRGHAFDTKIDQAGKQDIVQLAEAPISALSEPNHRDGRPRPRRGGRRRAGGPPAGSPPVVDAVVGLAFSTKGRPAGGVGKFRLRRQHRITLVPRGQQLE